MNMRNINKTITFLSKKYNTDKKMNDNIKSCNGLMGHDYANIYDKHLKKIKIYKMLEIGVSFGASIKMWDDYFSNKVDIYGIDINEKRFKKSDLENDKVKIFIGDQSSKLFLTNTFQTDKFDLIIDDGSHKIKDQLISLKLLFNKLKSGGIYVIEDLHTSFINGFHQKSDGMSTLEILEKLQNNKPINSKYINNLEYEHLKKNIDNIKIYKNKINKNKTYIIAFLNKK